MVTKCIILDNVKIEYIDYNDIDSTKCRIYLASCSKSKIQEIEKEFLDKNIHIIIIEKK